MQVTNRAAPTGRGQETFSCCCSREVGCRGAAEEEALQGRKHLGYTWSGEIQALTKGLEKDFCIAGLGGLRQKDKPLLVFEGNNRSELWTWLE